MEYPPKIHKKSLIFATFLWIHTKKEHIYTDMPRNFYRSSRCLTSFAVPAASTRSARCFAFSAEIPRI